MIKQKYARITPASMKKLALNTIDFLESKSLYGDLVVIYLGNKQRITATPQHHDTNDLKPNYTPIKTPAGKVVYLSDWNKQMPTEYHNPDTLTFTFENELYNELNKFGKLHDELNALFSKYGLYLEMGHAWSFSLYKI